MSYRNNTDNIYAVGASVVAKTHPDVKLVVKAYNQRIYYCAREVSSDNRQLAYYERELVAPDVRTTSS